MAQIKVLQHRYQVPAGSVQLPHGQYDTLGMPATIYWSPIDCGLACPSQVKLAPSDWYYVRDYTAIRLRKVEAGFITVVYPKGANYKEVPDDPPPVTIPPPPPPPPPVVEPPPPVIVQPPPVATPPPVEDDAPYTTGLCVDAGKAEFRKIIMFDETSEWRRKIDTAPVDPRSDSWLRACGSDAGACIKTVASIVNTDNWGDPWEGIPYSVVDRTQARIQPIYDFSAIADVIARNGANGDCYGDEADPGPMPIPLPPVIQGTRGGKAGYNGDGDKHIIVADLDDRDPAEDGGGMFLYELWNSYWVGNKLYAGMGSVFDLKKGDKQRPFFWSSASVSGLPYFAGVIRFEEILRGKIEHCIAFTAMYANGLSGCTGMATHHQYAGAMDSAISKPPMGAKMRLKAGFDISGFGPQARVILQALKEYGCVLVDGGHPIDLLCAPDKRWDLGQMADLWKVRVKPANFEFVEAGPIYSDMPAGPHPQWGEGPVIYKFWAEAAGNRTLLRWETGNASLHFITPAPGAVRGNRLYVNAPIGSGAKFTLTTRGLWERKGAPARLTITL